jgi:hypothetical protein
MRKQSEIQELRDIMQIGSEEPKCQCLVCIHNTQLNKAGFDLLNWVLGGGSKHIRRNIAKARNMHRRLAATHQAHAE